MGRRWLPLSLLLVLALAACRTTPAVSGSILIDGSSTVYLITEAMAEEFQKANPGIHVTVGISGTGGGFRKFCAGEIDIVDASRPIKPPEMEACRQKGIEFIELKVAFDGLAVVVNPENNWVDYLTVEELKKIWEPEAQGKVTRWSDIRPHWPDKELHLYGPGVDSGTYDYFTEVIVGKSGSSRGDFLASEDDNVLVQGVASDPLALGYFGFAYYMENADRLKLVPIDGGGGPVLPSYETILSGAYRPLSRPLFIYVSKAAAERPEVRAFIEFYLDPRNAEKLVKEVGYIPLPEGELGKSLERFRNRVTGSDYVH